MSAKTTTSRSTDHDESYKAFRASTRKRFTSVASRSAALFTTDVDPDALWESYLGAVDDRRTHDCSACRSFVKRYGGLVTISPEGRAKTALWRSHGGQGVPGQYQSAVLAMARLVNKSRVTGVFLSEASTWGQPVTGDWTHVAVTQPAKLVFRKTLLTAGQRMAELREDFATISRAVVDFDVSVVEQALTVLALESLHRSEKVRGPAQWLLDLHEARSGAKGDARRNVTWLAVATAPPGFTHPRTTMIGTLLVDIADGLSFEDASRRFASNMHPLRYQRPQAPPSSGQVAQAEKIVQALDAEGAFSRRFCHLDEVDSLWAPTTNSKAPTKGKDEGLFSNVETKLPSGGPRKRQGVPMVAPAAAMSWSMFRSEVLTEAKRVEFFAPRQRLGYTALVIATDQESAPILQWDSLEQRNTVSWYVWNGGSTAESFSLEPGKFHDVTAVTLKPPMWYGGEDRFDHQGQGVIFLIDGASDTHRNGGVGLFPECLRTELRAVRKTIESFSRNATIEDAGGPYAAGLLFTKGSSKWNGGRFRVTSIAGGITEYQLDRWE